jgi:hypothetical protein
MARQAIFVFDRANRAGTGTHKHVADDASGLSMRDEDEIVGMRGTVAAEGKGGVKRGTTVLSRRESR